MQKRSLLPRIDIDIYSVSCTHPKERGRLAARFEEDDDLALSTDTMQPLRPSPDVPETDIIITEIPTSSSALAPAIETRSTDVTSFITEPPRLPAPVPAAPTQAPRTTTATTMTAILTSIAQEAMTTLAPKRAARRGKRMPNTDEDDDDNNNIDERDRHR